MDLATLRERQGWTPETVLAQNPLKPTQQERGTEGKGQTLSEARQTGEHKCSERDKIV